ncbi:hypothetical protein [Streptomyces albiflavescens]|uniref:hypothetical protein n=1 Tax=Streptomyces albiflavescens TaxID=1623582 RepID=UPI00166EAD5E|nr:hypothetical protein [Streptomyces albiflavescens]
MRYSAGALRRARYRGLVKTRLDHTTSATALIRLAAWRNGHPLDRTNLVLSVVGDVSCS